jgi:hypothetical protein
VVITLISSLTPDDENVCATALLQHFVSVLRQLPIAYAIRIETSNQVLQHSAPVGDPATTVDPPLPATAVRTQPMGVPAAAAAGIASLLLN